MTDDSELFEAFVAGFMQSSEGYNAEYMYGEEIAHKLRPRFEEWRESDE